MKRALLVGINQYPGCPLNGCINDVVGMFQVLTTKFDFKAENIKVLTDREATKANILTGLGWLTAEAKEGDTLVFDYSGHGSQVNVTDLTDNTEVDRRDEIICNIDLDWNNPLRDHQIGAFFKSTPKTCEVFVLLDSCHSGSGLRNILSPQIEIGGGPIVTNRFMTPPLSNILMNPALVIKEDLSFQYLDPVVNVKAAKPRFLVSTAEQGDAILISGCRDDQTSADAFINGRYNGAATFSLINTLTKYNFDLSYEQLAGGMNDYMLKNGYTQNPQLECRLDFFSKKFLK